MEDAKPTTATILFVDVVESTAVRARLGEERADELRRVQDGLLTNAVAGAGGRVVKLLGDGLMAAFPAASDALAAAVTMQHAVAAYNGRGDRLAQLSIRVGLSTGDVSWEGTDCFGTPVVEASRLEAAAAPGQILCSDLVPMLARGRGGHEFRALGFMELKGLPEPVAVSELVWTAQPAVHLSLPPDLAARPARPFVSRSAELELAERILADAGRDRAVVLWVLGEPGIGKTRLATEIARRAHGLGAVVLFGRCSEDVQVPHQPFLEALRWFLSQLADDDLLANLGTLPGELTRLVPELGVRFPGLVASQSTPEVEQHHLFEAVRSWLASAAAAGAPGLRASGNLVFVIDDVHWATRATISLLGHIARSLERSRVVLVCTARTTAPDASEALADLAEDLVRRDRTTYRIELGGFGVEDIGHLLACAAGRDLDHRLATLAKQVEQETSGNPLFVDAVLAGLDEENRWTDPALRAAAAKEVPLSGRLVDTVARRLAHLGDQVGDVLRIASVVGLTFDLRVVAHAAGKRELELVDVLDQAARAGLVEEATSNHYRFSHALVRSVLLDSMSRARRVRLHLHVGEGLESLPDGPADERAAELAHHFGEAVPVGAGSKACQYFLVAGEQASRLLAHHDAAEAYGRALELLGELRPEERPDRAELLLYRGQALLRAGDITDARIALREASEAFWATGDADRLAEAAMSLDEASVRLGFSGDDSVDVARRALAALPVVESPLRARVMASEARALGFLPGHASESAARGEEALAMARALGDPATVADVLRKVCYRQKGVEKADEAARLGQEMFDLALQLDDDDLRAWALLLVTDAAAMTGDLSGWDRLMAEECVLVEVVRQPFYDFALVLRRYARAVLAGDLVLAEHLLERAAEISRAIGWALEGLYGIGMFFLRREQGRLAGLAPAVRRAVADGAALWRPGVAAIYAEVGLLDEARAEYERLAAGGFTGVPGDDTRLLCLGLLGEVCVTLRDSRRAPFFLDVLTPCQGRLLIFPPMGACLGPADRLRAKLAATIGDSAGARTGHEEALAFARRLGSPLWIAHCLEDLAIHLRPAEPGRAEALLHEAASLCEQHQLAGIGQRVSAALRHSI